MQALTDEEKKYARYTGERCPKPKRDAIIQLMAEGRAVDDVRRLVSVDRQTVLNVANAFAVEVADYERRMSAKLKRCKWALAERIEREVDSIPRQALGLTFKIVSDQEALDSGRAISRVDHVHHVDLFSDFPQFIQELEARPEIHEKNGAEIHLAGGKKPPLPTPGAQLQPIEVEAGQDPPADRARDWKSDVSGLPTQATQPILPIYSPDSTGTAPQIETARAAAGADTDADREGGGLRSAAPTDPAKDKGSQKFLGNGL
jgi:hypothetical protein